MPRRTIGSFFLRIFGFIGDEWVWKNITTAFNTTQLHLTFINSRSGNRCIDCLSRSFWSCWLDRIMKYTAVIVASLASASQAFTFVQPRTLGESASSLSMVLEKPKTKKLAKIETLKIDSDHLVKPLLVVRKRMHSKANNERTEVMYYILSPSDRYMSMTKKGPVPQASGRFG